MALRYPGRLKAVNSLPEIGRAIHPLYLRESRCRRTDRSGRQRKPVTAGARHRSGLRGIRRGRRGSCVGKPRVMHKESIRRAATAVREAIAAAGGVLLQPVMKVEVVVPDDNTGAVLGDLQARGASILGTDSEAGTTVIRADCGLMALIGYTTDLRSKTAGRGQFTMEFERFDAV